MPRESTFRKICQRLKNARYNAALKDPLTGKERKVRFKTLHKLLGLVTYLDWIMILITTLTTCSMMLETPKWRVMEDEYLQVGTIQVFFSFSIDFATFVSLTPADH